MASPQGVSIAATATVCIEQKTPETRQFFQRTACCVFVLCSTSFSKNLLLWGLIKSISVDVLKKPFSLHHGI